MLTGNNMVRLVFVSNNMLGQQAIFATPFGPFKNKLA
jgi:hypothetical protein